jgi:hypothetical protein
MGKFAYDRLPLEHMQKPLGFRAIELVTSIQIGLAFLVSSYAFFLLADHEFGLFRFGLFRQLSLSVQAAEFEVWFLGFLGYVEPGKVGVDRLLGIGITFLFELIVSGITLLTLKARNFGLLKVTAILVLVLRIINFLVLNDYRNPLSRYLTYPDASILTLAIFIVGSLLVVTFSFLRSVQQYMEESVQ